MSDKLNIIVPDKAIKSILDADAAITKLDISYSKFIKDISKGQEGLKGSQVSFVSLNKAKKESIKTDKDQDKVGKQLLAIEQKKKELADVRQAQIIKGNEQLKQRKVALKQELILGKEEAKTKEQLLVKNKQLRDSLNKVQVAGFNNRKERIASKKEVKKLTAEIDKNQKVINKSSDALVQSKNNIGNYGSAFGGLLTPIRTAGAALKAFLANPVVLIVGAIVAVFALFKKAMARSEEGQDRLNKVMTIASSIWDNLLDIVTIFGVTLFDVFPKMLQKVGNFFQRFTLGVYEGFLKAVLGINQFLGRVDKVAELKDKLAEVNEKQEELKETSKELGKEIKDGFQGAIDKARGLGAEIANDIKKAAELAAITAAFNKTERKIIVENAKLARDSAKLRAQAEDQKKIAAEESITALEKSFALDEKALSNELILAKARADMLQRTSDLASDTIEDKKAIAQAEAEVFNVETRFEEMRRQRTKMLNKLRMEAFRQENDRQKANLDIAKSNAEQLISINEEIADNELASIDDRTNALRENAAILQGFAEDQYQIEKTAIEKEVELRLKSQEDANVEILALQARLNADRIKASEEANGEILEIEDELFEMQIEANITAREREADRLINIARQKAQTEEQLAEEIANITKDMLQAQIDEAQKLVDASEINTVRRLEMEEELADAQQELDNVTTDQILSNADKRIEKFLEISETIANVASKAGDMIFEIRANGIEKEIAAFDKQKEYELSMAEGNSEAEARIEEKFAKKSNELKLKQAKNDRRQALFNIAISTAQAIARIWADVPKVDFGASTLILTGIAAGMGALQAAVVLSKPLPQFDKGTGGQYNTPARFIAGERSMEWVQDRSGAITQVNEPTVFSNAAGMRVYSNPEVERLISLQGGAADNRHTQAMHSDLHQDLRDIKKAIINQPVLLVDKNMNVFGRRKNKYTERIISKTRYGS